MARKVAGDIMIPLDKYPHVPYHATLKEAVKVMEDSVITVGDCKSLPRALLVFDEKHNLLGILRRRDILRALEPKFLKTMNLQTRKELFHVESDPDLLVLSTGRIARATREQAEHPVSEAMSPVVATCDYNDHVTKVIYRMVNFDQALLPVMKDRQVVGVVRSVDVFNEVARVLEETTA